MKYHKISDCFHIDPMLNIKRCIFAAFSNTVEYKRIDERILKSFDFFFYFTKMCISDNFSKIEFHVSILHANINSNKKL